MLSSNMITFIYQKSIHVYDHFLNQRDHLPESDIILSLFDLLIIYFYLSLSLRCISIYFSILSPDFSWFIFNTFSITHSFLNTCQNLAQGSDFLLELPMSSSSASELKSDPAVPSKFTIFVRYLNLGLAEFSLEKFQKCIHLIYRKFSSILRPQPLFAKVQLAVEKRSRHKVLSGSAEIRGRFKTAHDSTTDAWKYCPRIWTWPWLGSLCSYTRDPLGFIQSQHRAQGDVFTTTILGYNCTFIQSNEYIQSFTTATRKVLDVTAAYKLIAAPLIGEEAFFGQTKYMHQVVLSKSRTEQLHQRLWELTEQLLEIKWAQCVSSGDQTEVRDWRKIDLGQMLDYVIFGLDVFFLIGEQMVNVNLDRISHLFRIMDSDLSLVGILLPMIRGGHSPRKEAKNELLGFLKRDVQRRIERYVQHAVQLAFAPGPPDCPETWPDDPEEESQELPEILLRSELKELDEAILLDYHRGESSAISVINDKVEFVALFIYGFVWAAQTNSAAATIGLVHDILLHDQSQGLGDQCPDLSHAEKIRREFASAVLKDNSSRAPFLEDMPHLAHCLNETLRLRATGAWVRLAEKSFHLSPQGNQAPGIICPPGFIVLSPMPVSLNPITYPNPNRWDPDRYERAPFISSSSISDNDSSRHIPIDKKYLIPPTTPSSPYFASWGLGQGHCPGKHLAYKMISMTVARFFDTFEVRPLKERFEHANFEDVAVAGVQRLKNDFTVLIRKRC